MEERGRMTGFGGCGAGVVCAGVCASAGARGTPAKATVLRNPRRPVDLVGICCECSMFRGVEVADFGGFTFLYEQSQKGRGGERGAFGGSGDEVALWCVSPLRRPPFLRREIGW